MSEEKDEKLLNISDLEFRFDLNRNTIREKLRKAGIKPVDGHGRDKRYRLAEVEPYLDNSDSDMDELKKRKLAAEAEERELKVQERKGELVPIAEVKNELQKIFTKMHREIAVTMPKRVASKLKKAKDAQTVTAVLTKEVSEIFERLRTDHKEFCNESDR